MVVTELREVAQLSEARFAHVDLVSVGANRNRNAERSTERVPHQLCSVASVAFHERFYGHAVGSSAM